MVIKQRDEYEMQVMTFGATCSPCSARFVLKMNALQNDQCNPRSIKAIIKHHYIDDYVDSFDSIEQAIQISLDIRRIHANVLAKEGSEKVLGVYWDFVSDDFHFHLKFHRVDNSVITGQKTPTKRELLSIIMSTFDPLGFLSCFIVGGKLILREVWRSECKWDEEIPVDLAQSWEMWRKQLYNAADVRIPRCYFAFGIPTEVQLHIFVDASEFAFAAVAYWRYEVGNEIHVSFVTSKTKCAPLKTVSAPRLELQAAVLGTRLLQHILEGHDFSPKSFTLWSDSKTVLKWIGSKHRRYKPYVAHRVAEILSTTDVCNWKWVSTDDNIADEATRFSNKIDFSPRSRWLMGPGFLRTKESEWPSFCGIEEHLGEEEEISSKRCLLVQQTSLIEFAQFSSLSRIIRSFAWLIRFIARCVVKGTRCGGMACLLAS
ncbi:uncharacterized protein LOC101901826 [Musca domestica]|uniref:Uncharacterized protein LOC101901826 n=1 Tax=Musca domestica TaxID=7370 RepID=A0ABM3VKX6_MUSDO|nr:uncharacterized protein LOC101901826 [Musca domestica]XP_058986470.1 uncharacterized protein LOC101901826 [Musca domestica]